MDDTIFTRSQQVYFDQEPQPSSSSLSLQFPPPPPTSKTASLRLSPSTAQRLQTIQSFRVDEGYSEESPPILEDLLRRPHQITGDRITLPNWMTGLNDSLKEEFAYKLVRTLPTSSIASLVERLVPILHLDFVQILPSELVYHIFGYLNTQSLLSASLASKTWRRFALEPRLWRDLYKAQGWEYDEKEVRAFEEELRLRAEQEYKAQQEAKRQQEELDAAAKVAALEEYKLAPFKPSPQYKTRGLPSERFWESGQIEMDEAQNEAEIQAGPSSDITRDIRPTLGTFSFASIGSSSDDEEMYPSPHVTNQPTRPQTIFEPELCITPELTMPGYGYPRLNWLFLVKSRKRLEENWLHNRYTTFKIPHPNYALEGHGECIYTIQYSSKYLVSGSRDHTIRKWNIKTMRLIGSPLEGHSGSVLSLQFDESPGEDVIMSGSSDSSVIIWRFSTGEKLRTLKKAHADAVLNLRFNKNYLVTCSKDKCIKVWNRHALMPSDPDYPWGSKHLFGNNKRQPNNHPLVHQVMDPAQSLNPYAARQFTANPIPPYTTIQLLTGHAAAVNAIQIHGDEIASASGDRVIKIWNLKTGLCEKTMLGHSKGIACIQYDGKTVVSGSSDYTIRIFDRASGADLWKLEGHNGLVRTVQASRDRIVSGSYDETVRVWVKRSTYRGLQEEEGEDGGWVLSAILKQANNAGPSHPATPFGMGIAGIANNNSIAQIQQAIANHNAQQAAQQQAAAAHAAFQMHAAHINTAQANAHTIQQTLAAVPVQNGPMHAQAANAQTQIPGGFPQQVPVPPIPQFQPPPLAPILPVPHFQPPALAPVLPVPHFQPPALAPQPQAQAHHIAGPIQQVHNQCKVFKLQFDARWIICCCQDSRILGWDFANGEADIIESCRFFKG